MNWSELKSKKQTLTNKLNNYVAEANSQPSSAGSSVSVTNEKNLLRDFLNSDDAKKENNKLSKLFKNPSVQQEPQSTTTTSNKTLPLLNSVKEQYKKNGSMTPIKTPLPEKVHKEIKLKDFESLEKISQFNLEAIELTNLKKLYMLQPKVSISLSLSYPSLIYFWDFSFKRIRDRCFIACKKSRTATLMAPRTLKRCRTRSATAISCPI